MDALHTQYRIALQAEGTPSEAREQSRLFDACLDAGMPFDTADHVAWAGDAVTADLMGAA